MRRDWKLRAAGFVVIGACLLAWRALSADPWEASGKPDRVIDGDTLVMAGEVVRLWGIDAMELKQNCYADGGNIWPCGHIAELKIRLMVDIAYEKGGSFVCVAAVDHLDYYGRRLVLCAANGKDVGEALVLGGLAVAVDAHYKAAEQVARDLQLGLWSSQNVTPRDWRKGKGRI